MSLSKYKKKRNFKDTPEPEGKVTRAKKQLIFVVQRHHASRLHYDFRLELQGTLKSWAVPKGPSLNPEDKRLAVMVEDHPVSYAIFRGQIPEGNYGAGYVEVWDHGTYEPVDKDHKVTSAAQFARDIESGSIKFKLKGRKLKGEFALVNIKGDKKNWLLIKHRDKYSTEEAYDSEEHATKKALAYTESRSAKKAAKKAPIRNATKKTAVKKTATKKAVVKKKSLKKA